MRDRCLHFSLSLCLSLLLLLLLLLLSMAVVQAEQDKTADLSAIEAPDFTAQSVTDSSETIQLKDFSGQVVLLNFWASWCFPCRYEMPHFQKIYETFKDQGLTVVAVAVYDKLEDSQAFVDQYKDKYGFSFPLLFDHQEEAQKAFFVETVPWTYLIGRDGKLIPIPDPKTKKNELRVNDPTLWEQQETYDFLEKVLQS